MYLKHSQLPKPVIYYQTDIIELENDEHLKVFLKKNADADMLTLSDDGGVQNAFICAFFSGKDKEERRKVQSIQVHSDKERIRKYLLQHHQYHSPSPINVAPGVISCIKLQNSKL